MPRFPASPLPAGFQIAQREGGLWLQREIMPGIWQDVGGPYTQRWSAVQRAEREAAKLRHVRDIALGR